MNRTTLALLVLALFLCGPRPAEAEQAPADAKAPPSAAPETKNEDPAVTDFGVEKGEPIDAGFLFDKGKYIDAPYIVERRGLSVYINGVRVERGPEWPPFEYAVKDDPGDPPPGVSPTDRAPAGVDPRDTYWFRKGRYLLSHFDPATAARMMMETYRKSDTIAEVIPSPATPQRFTVVTKSGVKFSVSMEGGADRERDRPPDKEALLASARSAMKACEDLLKFGMMLIQVGASRSTCGPKEAADFIGVLLSEPTPDGRLRALETKGHLPPKSPFGVIATQFSAGPQLKERLEKLKQKPR